MSTTELDPALVVRDAIVKVLGYPFDADAEEIEAFRDKAADPQALIVEDLGGDSLDAVEIAMEIEDALGLQMLLDQLEEAKTVADLVRFTSEAIATAGLKGKAA